MQVTLPHKFTFRPYQIEPWNQVLKPTFQRGVLVWPRRNGKDLLCWNMLIAKAMQRVGLYYYIGPYYNQIRQIIWEGIDGGGRRFLDYIPKDLLEGTPTKLDMRINLKGGSQIKLQGSDNIDSILGTNPVGIVFTEFSLHKPEAWDYLRPILAENGGWALFNGTPRGLNHLYQLYQKATRDDGWYTNLLSRDDTGVPALDAIQKDRDSGMPESLIDQEYYCKWTASTEETLIPLDIVQPCVEKGLDPTEYSFAPRIIGADVAFAAKGDKAVIAKRQGRMLHPLQKFQGLDNMSFATKIANEINQWRANIVFIDAGRGEGVIHRLDQLGYGRVVVPVHFGGKSFSELFLNKRAEIWCRMRDWFTGPTSPSIPNDEDLITSITTPKFWTNDKGYLQLESKKLIKVSMDEGDAVALTFSEDTPLPVAQDSSMTPAERYMMAKIQEASSTAKVHYDVLNYLNADADFLASFN